MSEAVTKNKALMRRVSEQMWNGADPAAAAEFFAGDKIIEHHTWWHRAILLEQLKGDRT